MASTSNSRFILSPEQLKAYLIRIHHPKPSSPEDSISNGHDDDHDDNNNGHNNNNNNTVGLGLLTSLQRQHLAFIPFENLSVHYSSTDDHDAVTLDPEKVYTKIVTRQRGGYCMENNLLFGILLRTLGFTVYSVGGRVSHDVMNVPDGGYGGWLHMANIVTLADGKRYMVDVGFGINAPTQPHPLESGVVLPGVDSQEMRLLWDTIAPTTSANQQLWILQWKDVGSEQWLTNYCFTETEFLPSDYDILNYYTYTSPKSWFTQVVVLAKFIQLEAQGPLVGSLVMLNGEFKRRIGAKNEGTIETCSTEGERLAALKKYFDIDLSEKEKEGIRDTKCELKA